MPNPAQFRDRIDVKPGSLVSPLRTKNGEWYSGSNLDKEFAHDHLVPWLSTEDFQAARALADQYIEKYNADQYEVYHAFGVLEHERRVGSTSYACAACYTVLYQHQLVACDEQCGRSICVTTDSRQGCIPVTIDNLDVMHYTCPPCCVKGKTRYPFTWNCEMPWANKWIGLEPLLVVCMSWCGVTEPSPCDVIRRHLETKFDLTRIGFRWVSIRMSDKDRLDLDHAFRKQDILNFFRHYKNGRFLLIINALSPTASGRLLIDKDQHVSRAGSPLNLSSMKGLSVSEIIEEYFPESNFHLPVRRGHIFHSTEPDPVKGLILVSPGNVFRNTETFNDIKQLIDTRIFDFALGFAKPHIEEWDIADRISIFTSKVFVDDINPFTARRHVFSKALCNNGDAMDQVMLILAVPDATLEEGEVIEESWAQQWSAWKPLSFRKIDKNASYTTCSSVQVVKSDRTIAGFKPPGCPKCQDPSATRLLKGNCIRCQSCKLGGTHSVPQAGFHYLEFDDVLVWPWPLSISEWSPDYKWADG